MIYDAVQTLKGILPAPLVALVRSLGLARVLARFYADAEVELTYQRGFRAKLDQIPDWQDRLLEYWRTYRLLDQLLVHAPVTPETRVLDVGCGLTTVLHCLPRTVVGPGCRIGVDPLADQYRQLYVYPPPLRILTGPAEALPNLDQSFDVVFCSNVLDHVKDPAKALAEMRRVLAPDGHLILTVELFETAKARGAAHPHSLTRAAVEALLAKDFVVLESHLQPWVGLKQYLVEGKTQAHHQEWVGVCRVR